MIKNTRSLRTTLLRVIMIPTAAVIAILFGVILLGANLIRNEIVNYQKLLIDALARQSEQYLIETGRLMNSLAYAMVDFPLENQTKLLAQTRRNYSRFSTFYLLNETGQVLVEETDTFTILDLDMSGERFFRHARDSEQTYFSDPFISLTTGQITVTGAVPIFTGDQFRGMLVGELNLELLQQTIEQVDVGECCTSFIVDRRGTVVVHPNQTWVQEQRNLGNLSLVQKGLTGKDTFKLFYDSSQDTWMIGSAIPMTWNWVIVTMRPLVEVARPLIILLVASGLAFSLSVALFIWAQVSSSRQITHPISILTKKADALAREPYEDLPIEHIGTFSEIISLGQSFTRMAEAISERTTRLLETNDALKKELQERKRAEEALRKEHDLIARIAETSPAGIVLVNRQGHITFANAKAEQVMGLTKDKITQRMYNAPEWHITDYNGKLFPDEQLPFRQVMTTGKAVSNVHHAIEWPDGQRVLLSINATPLFNEVGQVDGMVATLEDVSERVRTEKALRESEERFSLFMDYLPAIVFIKDEESRTLYVNKHMNEVLGAKDWIGRTALELFPKDIAEAMIVDDKKTLTEGYQMIVETIPDKHGINHIYQTHKFSIERSDKPPLLGGIALDITERKQAEEALKASELRVRSLIEHTTDAVFCYEYNPPIPTDLPLEEQVKLLYQCTLIECNDVCARSYGARRADEVIGKHLTELFGTAPGSLDSLFTALIQGNYHVVDGLGVEKLEDGTERYFSNNGHGILEDGKLLRVWGTFRDITERKRAEEQIRQLNAELEERVKQRTAELEAVNKELKSFAYVVSHDLKTPLRGISHLAHWIVEDYAEAFDEQGKKMANLLIGRVKRMDNLIDGILQYSRVGRILGEEESIDLNTLVRDVIDNLSPPEHIQISIEHELPGIAGDTIRFIQVFQNLIGNAVKFMDKPGGRITISCVDEGPHWTFRVADNGPGIDKKYHEKIFQIFQTLSPPDDHESTGIGLALVKKIVEVYGGKIWVESAPGQGSIFSFTLPKITI